MEVVLALALGLVVGLVAGALVGVYFVGNIVGRSLRREMDAGRITRDEAERISNFGAR